MTLGHLTAKFSRFRFFTAFYDFMTELGSCNCCCRTSSAVLCSRPFSLVGQSYGRNIAAAICDYWDTRIFIRKKLIENEIRMLKILRKS